MRGHLDSARTDLTTARFLRRYGAYLVAVDHLLSLREPAHYKLGANDHGTTRRNCDLGALPPISPYPKAGGIVGGRYRPGLRVSRREWGSLYANE